MPESRIKLKELASQIGKDAKELLPAAQKLGSSIRSVQGSVSEEEAQRLRERFAAPREDARPQGEGVKVRRRHVRGEDAPRAAAPAPEAPSAPSAPETPQETSAAPLPAVETGKKEEPARQAARSRSVETPRARIIRRPGEQAEATPAARPPAAAVIAMPPQPRNEETAKPAPKQPPVSKKPERPAVSPVFAALKERDEAARAEKAAERAERSSTKARLHRGGHARSRKRS